MVLKLRRIRLNDLFQKRKQNIIFGKKGNWNSPINLSSLNGTNGFINNQSSYQSAYQSANPNYINKNSNIIDKFYNIFLQEAKRIHKSIQIKNSYLTEGSQSKIKPTLLNEYGIFSKKTYESDLIQGLLNTYNQTGTLSNEQYKQLADNMDGNAFKFNYFSNCSYEKTKERPWENP